MVGAVSGGGREFGEEGVDETGWEGVYLEGDEVAAVQGFAVREAGDVLGEGGGEGVEGGGGGGEGDGADEVDAGGMGGHDGWVDGEAGRTLVGRRWYVRVFRTVGLNTSWTHVRWSLMV